MTGNPLSKIAAKVWKDAVPEFTKGCPFKVCSVLKRSLTIVLTDFLFKFKGIFNISRWDFNKVAKKFFPPILAGIKILIMQ